MMALGTLLLFAPLLIVSANQALISDADCNDANIFEAVDVGLKSYNAGKVYGNLYILHRITDARIQPESDGVLRNFVDYEIREGACSVKSGKDWKECNLFSTKLAVKKCSAHVLLNRQLNTSEIIFQSCSGPIHASVTGEAVGSLKSTDPNDTVVLEMVQLSIDRMNKLGNHPFHFSLEKVLNAWRQVVSGWKFHINYTIKQTNCSKHHFKNASSEECSFDINGQSGKCSSHVHWTVQGQIDITDMTCTSDSGFCLNCPNAIENNDPELLNLLMQFIDEYNVNNSHPALYKMSKVVTATEEGSHPKQYEVEFEMKETNCSKAEYAILGEECDFIDSQKLFECEVKMIVTKETVTHSHVCLETRNFLLRYQGFSPLRSAVYVRDPGHDHKGEKHEKKETRKKKNKGKKKNKHGSSEESREEETFINPEKATTIERRCPGNVWQPKWKQPNIPFELFPDLPIHLPKQDSHILRDDSTHIQGGDY